MPAASRICQPGARHAEVVSTLASIRYIDRHDMLATMTARRTIPSSVGSLAALVDLPDTSAFPVVILLHGFTGWKEEEHLATLAEALCTNGVGALRFDAPGSGESDGSFTDDYRMSNYLTAVREVIDYSQREFGISRESTALWGHSMGGFVAIASACLLQNVAAVCGSQSSVGRRSFSDEEVERWRSSGWASFPNQRFPTLELPYAFYLDRRKYDIFEVIDQLRAPLLLIAGTLDEIASPSQVKSIYEASPEPKTYREFPVGHDYAVDLEQLALINEATVAFFAEHLST